MGGFYCCEAIYHLVYVRLLLSLGLKPKHDKAYTQTLIAQYLLSTWDKIWNYINETITTTRQEKPSFKDSTFSQTNLNLDS